MSFRGAPLNVLDYIRGMDEQLRRERANTGTTRIPSQRIGGFIVEIDNALDTPRIKLTEVETGDITYCCTPIGDDVTCPEIPPFSWFGVVSGTDIFPGYMVPALMVIQEAAVVQETAQDGLAFRVLVNGATATALGVDYVVADPVRAQRYDLGLIIAQNADVTVEITDIGGGACEDLTIILRTCRTPTIVYEG
jgi:hypothetical protein